LEKNSSPRLLASDLSKCHDIYTAIKITARDRWACNWASDNDIDEQIFDTLCKVVAAALNPRPNHRSTPQQILQMICHEGKKFGHAKYVWLIPSYQ
jgi:hypothetical protein